MWLDDLHGQTRTAKITREQADEIRRLRREGAKTRDLARRYGLTQEHIARICRREAWR